MMNHSSLRQFFSSVYPFASVERASSLCAFVNMILAGTAVAASAILLSLSISVLALALLALVLLVLRISLLVLCEPPRIPRATTPPLLQPAAYVS